MNRSLIKLAALSVAVAGALSLADVARADEAGDKLKAAVAQAYKDTTSYEAMTKFNMSQNKGRRILSQGIPDIRVVFDRAANRVLVDRPDVFCASDGDKIRARHEQVKDKFIETDVPKPLTLSGLSTAVPFLSRSPQPDVAALLSEDPFAALCSSIGDDATPVTEFKALPADPDDKEARPGLQMTTRSGVLTLRVDPKTNLVRTAVLDVDTVQMGWKPGETVQIRYDIDIKSRNAAIGKEAFAFDAAGGKAFPSALAMLGESEPVHALVGKAAPEFDLKDLNGKSVKLSEIKEEVIVLDFWATWCGPCVKGLPQIQAVAKWAADNKKSVAFYAINGGESPEKVQAFVKKMNLTLPVLMDPDMAAKEVYLADAIPQTVIITKGKVHNIIVGVAPDAENELKKVIDAALGAKKTADATSAK